MSRIIYLPTYSYAMTTTQRRSRKISFIIQNVDQVPIQIWVLFWVMVKKFCKNQKCRVLIEGTFHISVLKGMTCVNFLPSPLSKNFLTLISVCRTMERTLNMFDLSFYLDWVNTEWKRVAAKRHELQSIPNFYSPR